MPIPHPVWCPAWRTTAEEQFVSTVPGDLTEDILVTVAGDQCACLPITAETLCLDWMWERWNEDLTPVHRETFTNGLLALMAISALEHTGQDIDDLMAAVAGFIAWLDEPLSAVDCLHCGDPLTKSEYENREAGIGTSSVCDYCEQLRSNC